MMFSGTFVQCEAVNFGFVVGNIARCSARWLRLMSGHSSQSSHSTHTRFSLVVISCVHRLFSLAHGAVALIVSVSYGTSHFLHARHLF